MDWYEAILLGIIQGIAEFLPISSDGHLTLAKRLMDLNQGRTASGKDDLFFFVMLHIGTLCAILNHYRGEIVLGARSLVTGVSSSPEYEPRAIRRACTLVVIGTIPAVILGLSFKSAVEKTLENLYFTAAGFLVTALALFWIVAVGNTRDKRATEAGGGSASGGVMGRGLFEMTVWDALLIGLAQAVAILPGVSRSGMTISLALGLGLARVWSVNFSLMLAIPAIAGATVLELLDIPWASITADFWIKTIVATIVSGFVGVLAIMLLVKSVRGGRLWYFAVYLVILATALILGILARPSLAGGNVEPTDPNPSAVQIRIHGHDDVAAGMSDEFAATTCAPVVRAGFTGRSLPISMPMSMRFFWGASIDVMSRSMGNGYVKKRRLSSDPDGAARSCAEFGLGDGYSAGPVGRLAGQSSRRSRSGIA